MSFNDLERGIPSSTVSGIEAEREFQRLADRISRDIFEISNNVASTQKLVGQFGTPKDSTDMRQKLHKLGEDTRELVKSTTGDLKTLTNMTSAQSMDSRQRKLTQQKLQKEFEQVLKRYQSVSRLSAEKSREYVEKAKAAQHHLDEDVAEDEPLISDRQRLEQVKQLEPEIEYNEALIQEREEELIEIEKSITEVNEIFRDLGTMVNEQQYMLDNIESNVSNVAINLENATGELRTASRYQKNSRNRMCCMLMVLAIIILVIVLAVIL